MISHIYVRGRFEASHFDPGYRVLIISITDPGSDKVKFERYCVMDQKDVLRLSYDDVDVGRYEAGELEHFSVHPMLPYHAKQIKPFLVSRLREGVDKLLIHCEAGRSRSPSTAMAICDAMNLERSIIDWSRSVNQEPPNQHVYQLCYEALRSE